MSRLGPFKSLLALTRQKLNVQALFLEPWQSKWIAWRLCTMTTEFSANFCKFTMACAHVSVLLLACPLPLYARRWDLRSSSSESNHFHPPTRFIIPYFYYYVVTLQLRNPQCVSITHIIPSITFWHSWFNRAFFPLISKRMLGVFLS